MNCAQMHQPCNMARQHPRKSETKGNLNKREPNKRHILIYIYHQNQLLLLSTALTVVATRGIWPYMAANVLRHLDLCKLWPFKLLMPLDPISNIVPAVVSRTWMWATRLEPRTGRIAYGGHLQYAAHVHALLCFSAQLFCFYVDAKLIHFLFFLHWIIQMIHEFVANSSIGQAVFF